jgi:hypothetical protein
MTGTRIMQSAMIANRPRILFIADSSFFRASYLNYTMSGIIILVLLNFIGKFEVASTQIKLFVRSAIYDRKTR